MKRLFFALMFAISVHAALLLIKINTSPKPESLLKSEPIKITMSYRQIKKNQPKIIKSDLKKEKKQVLIKKPIPPANKKFKPVKKKQLAKTIKNPDREVEPKLNSKPVFKQDQTPEKLPPAQNKVLNPKQESGSDSAVEKNIKNKSDNKDKSFPPEKTLNAAVTHTQAIPKYKINPNISYPRIAKRKGYQGKVLLLVLVSKTGAAKKVLISKSSGHKLLDKAARKAVSQWQFYPGTKDGKPVEMSVEVPIRFDLK